MKIDFSDHTKLDKETYLAFQSFCNDNKNYFNEIIGKIYNSLNKNLDWLLSSTASRNITDYSLYRDFCTILFIKKLIKNNKDIDEVIVETKNVKKILKSFIINDKIKINVKKNKNRPGVLKKILVFLYCIMFNIIKYCACRLSSYKKTNLPKLPLTLIDTNVVQNATSSYNKSFYGNLWDLLEDDQKKTIFFLPNIFCTNVWTLYSVFTKLRKTDPSFVIKEDYLKISDILYALFYCLRIRFIKIKSIYHEDVDISQLFISDLRSLEGYQNSVQGILTFRFFMRLKEIGVNLKMVVDWWENQPHDKGLHLGIHEFYQRTSVLGYTSGPSNLALQYYPTSYEHINHVVPNTISVQGKAYINGIKKINLKQKVNVAPAFRFYSVYNNFLHSPDPSIYTILVLLPVYLKNSLYILKSINVYIKKYNPSKIRIWIKPHPTMKNKAIKKLTKNLSINCEIVTGDIVASLSKANILVGSMTTTCLEAMGLGIPVIVLEQPYGLFGLLTMPKGIPQNFWKHCTSAEDIFDAIDYFRSKAENFQDTRDYIRENYFEQVTKDSIEKFLELK